MSPGKVSLKDRIFSRLQWGKINLFDRLPTAPKDFAWKIRWRMNHDHNPLFVEIQDKYRVKAYAEKRGVRAAETFYVTDEPETIPFDSLPDKFFIKANHGCKWNILCNQNNFYLYSDGEQLIGKQEFSKYRITKEEIIDLCHSWLNTTYSKREWAYQHIEPKIMVEEVLEQRQGGELIDYRCFTFDGVVKAIYIDTPSQSINGQRFFVTPGWQELVFEHPEQIIPYTKPDNFDEIVKSAEKLAKGIDFVRIDLYDTTRGITLGEVSVYHMGGNPNTPTNDAAFNRWLGDQWVLPVR